MYTELMISSLLDLDKTIARDIFTDYNYPWEVLPAIKKFIVELGNTLGDNYYKIADDVWVAKSATIAPTASITGPCIIDECAELRHCAFIRGAVIVGKNAVVGNSVELKNTIIFDNAQVPHYNYVGDSIIGYKAHMGAQALTSNVKSDKTLTTVLYKGEKIETGLKKFGAILGDYVEVGCSTVLNPGSVVGRNTNIYPLSFVRGYIEEKSIFKKTSVIKKW